MRTSLASWLVGGLLAFGAVAANADCKLLEVAEFHLDPDYASPVVDGTINGVPVKVAFDTGSGFSSINRTAADRLGLTLEQTDRRSYGPGGNTAIYLAHVKQLKVGNLVKGGMDIPVAGVTHRESSIALTLGFDFFVQTAVEFDLADHAVRMFKPQGCAPPQLVYWGAAYSQVEMLPWSPDSPTLQAPVMVNSKRMLAVLSSGSGYSTIDAGEAASLGVARPANSQVSTVVESGPKPLSQWPGVFESFALGDEKVSNVKLMVESFQPDMAEMQTGSIVPQRLRDTPGLYIGADFFRAHRIMVDPHDRLILFSYAGGPVFRTDLAG